VEKKEKRTGAYILSLYKRDEGGRERERERERERKDERGRKGGKGEAANGNGRKGDL